MNIEKKLHKDHTKERDEDWAEECDEYFKNWDEDLEDETH